MRQYLSREDIQDLAGRLELDVRLERPLVDHDLGIHLPDITLVGILDAVEHLPDGRVRPLDWKTAASKQGYSPASLAQHFQGSLYCWLLGRDREGQASARLSLHVGYKTARPNWQEYEVELGRDAQQRALRTVEAVYRAMESGWAFPEPSFLCGGCPYRDRCRSWTGSPTPEAHHDLFAAEILDAAVPTS